MKRVAGNRYMTSVRALDGRSVFLLHFPGSGVALLGVVSKDDGSTYISEAGLIKLRSDIDKHLRAMRGGKP